MPKDWKQLTLVLRLCMAIWSGLAQPSLDVVYTIGEGLPLQYRLWIKRLFRGPSFKSENFDLAYHERLVKRTS